MTYPPPLDDLDEIEAHAELEAARNGHDPNLLWAGQTLALVAAIRRLETRNTNLEEALRNTAAALDDAIKAAVSSEWDQADYDAWNLARSRAEALLGEEAA